MNKTCAISKCGSDLSLAGTSLSSPVLSILVVSRRRTIAAVIGAHEAPLQFLPPVTAAATILASGARALQFDRFAVFAFFADLFFDLAPPAFRDPRAQES